MNLHKTATWDRGTLTYILRMVRDHYGRHFTVRDYTEWTKRVAGTWPCVQTYIRHFGSFTKAQLAAGV